MSPLNVTFKLDDIAPDGRIGLIALATDYNSETDLRRMLPPGVDLFTNRVLNANPLTIESLRATTGDITRAAAGILPGRGVDVMIYGCTSGTAAIGETELQRLIHQAHPAIPCTNPIAAATAALHALNVRRLSILTPYTDAVNAPVAEDFRQRGFDILNIEGFGLTNDTEMTEIPLAAIVEAAPQALEPGAEALFISCTALRAAAIVEHLEHQLNVPVVTSNQALVWHALRLLDNPTTVRGFGRLFTCPLPDPLADPLADPLPGPLAMHPAT